MKHILLCATILLLTGLRGPAALADPTYYASTPVLSPANGASFVLWAPNYGYPVPISITNQYVKVSGATPNSNVSMGWVLADGEGTTGNVRTLIEIVTMPTAQVMTDASGSHTEKVGGTSDSYSTTVGKTVGSFVIGSQTTVKDARGIAQNNINLTSTYNVDQGV